MPTPEQVEKIELTKKVLRISCGEGSRPSDGVECGDDMAIGVTTISDNFKSDEIIYDYEVSGGQIVGQGKNVIWDLKDALPGTYRISVSIKDKQRKIIGKTKDEILTVERCDCCGLCLCSIFKITSPDISSPDSTVKRGDAIVFMVEFEETGTLIGSEDPKYEWIVSGGEIIYEDYKNSLVRIKVNPEKNVNELKVTVKISDDSNCYGSCNSEVSATVKIVDN